MEGRIHSLETFGLVDGPGVRFVIFMQGCGLRCGYCHNPDTWDVNGGKIWTAEKLFEKAYRYKPYWLKGGKLNGGITVSGGEPLLQAEFVAELFQICHEHGVNTCLDTAGSVWNENVEKVFEHTDLCMLDYKMTNDEDYRKYIGCSIDKPEFFMHKLAEKGVKSWVRYVVCPTVNDTVERVELVKKFAAINPLNEKIELLPFHKLCQGKYDEMGIEFPFGNLPIPTSEKMAELNAVLQK